ncbi:hypothetical protein A2524_02940 [Candidatus Wolfebacteria bacterium RIFOXYD12_FULL_48_21]|uniref:Peptidase M19 n=1 Tax=Candidatus Wolfebacteria bacterium RIFOXYD1_FULL_48_65 TaxID=1802561 RepID=A0A1F8E4P1_9BACT|nr:MAG: hypothetical protein A2610_02220 [Candidatus Wolfebacteria bacterium RIFOXYD1_FULL_48_65]OGM95022.1 MAG: hypothetical protein A2524_02940 [Candidatus Wolfebacteria bacterium RIFOXYD12_FULL_48_21]OGM95840.1 MAG: hypothetical protein A2532_02135 [Candidatus Wolfebacteria bacterium RIFOXYD2_FULL_48_11]
MDKKLFIGDAMAFLGLPGELPKVEMGMMPNLAHVTCAPPVGLCVKHTGLLLRAIERFKVELARSGGDQVVIASKVTDLDEDDRMKVVLGLQNMPDDINHTALRQLRAMGVRVLALAYDKANRYGSGCLNLDVGLTEAGRGVLRCMAELGFILDLSHAGHRMAREALEWIDRKNLDMEVMASHCGCYALYPHIFNLPDDVLHAIAKRRGVVGIAGLTFILHQENNGIGPFFDHLEHAVEVCGKNNVVIGSAAPYGKYMMKEEQTAFVKMNALLDPHGTLSTRSPSHALISQGNLYKFAMLGEMPVEDIFGKNLLNFFRRSLPVD